MSGLIPQLRSLTHVRHVIAWAGQYERTLSALSMIGGFAFDNYSFRRIDLPNTQIVFVSYLILASASISLLHFLERREEDGKAAPRWRSFLPMATQFALGGLWSGFLVFYSRAAVVAASWPFLLLLVGIFIGNEVLRKYQSRLAFTATLFFFGLFSYTIVTVPVVTRTIGMYTFLLSGAVAIGIFVLFLNLLATLGFAQWRRARWQIAAGSLGVYAIINLFYFTNILPPLPLAMSRGGIYHLVKKTGDKYDAVSENQLWTTFFGFSPVMHLQAGEPLYFYSAVFAPVQLSTRIVHRWQRYDPKRKKWHTESSVSFPITGGRDGGYRGYTIKTHPAPGEWRVDVDTADGHIIGRITFSVEEAAVTPAPVPETLE